MAKKIKTEQMQNSPVSAKKETLKKATKKVISAVTTKAKAEGASESTPPVKQPTSKTTRRSAAKAKAPSFSTEDVALRAYFIAENRQKHGLPGNSTTDWIEAERQLAEEAKKPTRKRTAKKATKQA